MFIELRLQIAQSPIGAVCPVEKRCRSLELRGELAFFYKHIARTGLKLMRMHGHTG